MLKLTSSAYITQEGTRGGARNLKELKKLWGKLPSDFKTETKPIVSQIEKALRKPSKFDVYRSKVSELHKKLKALQETPG